MRHITIILIMLLYPLIATSATYYDAVLVQLALRQQVDPKVVRAIIKVESGGRVHARNKDHYGLMQIARAVHAPHMPPATLMLPATNLDLGIGVLGACQRRHKTLYKTLACYNGTLRRPRAADRYVLKVTKAMRLDQ